MKSRMVFESIKNFYVEQQQKYFMTDIRALGWHDQTEYVLRFKIASGIGDLTGRSILDVGCGTGGLLSFLKGQGVKVRYTGVDFVSSSADACKVNHLDAHVVCGNILDTSLSLGAKQFEYVFCLGTLNISEAGFHETFRLMVRRMFELCQIGVALNFLCDEHMLVPSRYHYEDVDGVRNFCEKELGARVVIADMTELRCECTMFVYRV